MSCYLNYSRFRSGFEYFFCIFPPRATVDGQEIKVDKATGRGDGGGGGGGRGRGRGGGYGGRGRGGGGKLENKFWDGNPVTALFYRCSKWAMVVQAILFTNLFQVFEILKKVRN